MSRWFRHYAGMCRDDKLVRAALRCKQPIERVVWVWSAILESAAEVNDDGRYEVDSAEMAWFLRCDEGDVVSIEVALGGLQRLDEGRVAHWAERQFQSDRSAARMQRHRERRKSEQHRNSDGTSDERDVTVTSLSRHGDAPETETEEETERKKEPTSDEVGRAEPVAAIAEQIKSDCQSPEAIAAAERQQLWSEGLPALIAMGVSEKQARPVIGRWLRDADDDALRVLGAIQRAREHAPMDPIPWITAGFAKIKSRRETSNDRTAALTNALGPSLYDLAEQRGRAGADGPGGGHLLALPGAG